MTGLRLRGIRRARPDSGVALIEAALILPFLALLVFGMIEAGFAFRDGNILLEPRNKRPAPTPASPRT